MKVKSVLFLLLFTIFYTTAFSQEKITWKELTTVYRKEMLTNKSDDKKATSEFYEDVLSKESDDKKTISLKDVEGKKVTIRGYFLDLGADSLWYMLSRFPFENCFFCTGVGPETVVDLENFLNEKSKFKTDDIVTVTGNLYLVKEGDEYFYTLKNCTVKLSES
ncbi:hypothetical protein UMM65_11265 [Aureibaculum sp. 2210JD6-5]|uniref:hypothetical protein n=1 Tax=Aureibaculum sp. 2210JD6-5 TaxID=3103957 RepID=UPI002AAE93EE|nr:hypothetical protein [Aureibaculum sp. 2210JD6-5]MDY7395826.1 hypothetical protein [Aureibaculum sp. 2210JD6-5]